MRLKIIVCWFFTLGVAWAQEGSSSAVSILALGDINLGRHVGQELLKENIDYPFARAKETLVKADFVFANLESQITDQNGETQHPRDRYIFCAPPSAARSLKKAGMSVVSTANNHAFDYKMRGLTETLDFLDDADVASTGTSRDSAGFFRPVILERNGIKIGIVGYTQFVNRKTGWQGHVNLYDEQRIVREIGELRRDVDVVIASYHGGVEYVEKPNRTTRRQMEQLVDAGADIVIGHHPHVPQGIRLYKGKWIFYSLGNFVFYQPQRSWTQLSFATQLTFVKRTGNVEVERIILLPHYAGFQPTFEVTREDRTILLERLSRLSNVSITEKDGVIIVHEVTDVG